VTRTLLSRSKVNLQGTGLIVAASRTAGKYYNHWRHHHHEHHHQQHVITSDHQSSLSLSLSLSLCGILLYYYTVLANMLLALAVSNSILPLRFNGHFPRGPRLAGTRISPFLHFIGATGDEGGGDNWSYKTYKAPVKMSPTTNQHPVVLQAGCPSCRQTNSVSAEATVFSVSLCPF